eukprot:Awhi_evm2s6226
MPYDKRNNKYNQNNNVCSTCKVGHIFCDASLEKTRQALLDLPSLLYFSHSFSIDQESHLDERFCNEKHVRVPCRSEIGQVGFEATDTGDFEKLELAEFNPPHLQGYWYSDHCIHHTKYTLASTEKSRRRVQI